MADGYHIIQKPVTFDNSECNINHDNVKYLIILAVILFVCDILNEIGLFQVAPLVMRIGTALGMVFYLMPAILLFKPLCLFKNTDNMIFKRRHKYLILAFAWLGTAISCVMLTHHTIILMAVPIMITAQYRNSSKLVHITVLLGTLCVLLGVYGGYFLGCFDANLLHEGITDTNAADLSIRIEWATTERMIELLTHYVLPREFAVLALIMLATNISKRSTKMLRRQADLQAVAKKEMQRTNAIQRQIIVGMANLIENRDNNTGEHVKRTSFYVKRIIDKLKTETVYSSELLDTTADTIVRAAPMHDIGKIVVADRILQKHGKLTPEEYEEIKLHTTKGATIIKNVLGNIEDEDFLRVATEIAQYHHERYDGTGYPDGLAGDKIPLCARIMAVADVFDALISKRVYKGPIPPEQAFEIIESQSGKQFDPIVTSAFLSLKPQITEYLGDKFNDG